MAKIETYDIAVPVVLSDKLIGTDTTNNETKNFTVGDIINLVGSGTNTEYSLATAQDVLNVDINLNDTDGGQTTAKLVPSGSITLTDLGSNQIQIASSGEDNRGVNLGGGTGIFAQKTGVDLEFKSLTTGANVSISASATEIQIAATNDNTTYDLGSAQNASNVDVTLTGSDATTDTVKLVAGTNITLTDNGSNEVTIASADSDTTYDLGAVGAAGNINLALTGSDGTNDVVQVTAGTNITLTDNGANVFTIDSSGVTSLAALTDTNITAPTNNQILVYNGAQWVNSNLNITGPEKLIQNVTGGYAAVPVTPNSTQDLIFNSVTGNFNTGSVHLHQNNLVPQSNGFECSANCQAEISMTGFMEINHATDEIIFVVYENAASLREARFVSDDTGDFVVSFHSHFELTAGAIYTFGIITPPSNTADLTVKAITEFTTEILR